MSEPDSWHIRTSRQVLDQLGSGEGGLDSAEARARLERLGPNELAVAGPVSPWTLLLGQFKNFLIIILLVATVLSGFLGHALEAIAIGVIILFAVLLGFLQEFRAERALEALKKMTAPEARVLRGGIEVQVPSRELVTGDLIVLKAGDKVPADARVMQAVNLKIDESSLTGESLTVEKHSEALAQAVASLGDRQNMVYSGTIVTYGRGRAVVVATGMATEFGKITGLLQSVPEARTPLQENMDRVGRALALAALGVVTLIVFLGVLRGAELLEMFMFGIALAVAVVPEALPAVITISLALGVQRMARRNALMRHLPTVETLGCVSVICTDKTGTLTRDEMTVRKLYVGERLIDVSGSGYDPEGEFTFHGRKLDRFEPLTGFLRAAALASDAGLRRVEGGWEMEGDPTEGALVAAAAKWGLDKVTLEADWPRVDEIPFSSERRRMTTLHRGAGEGLACSKGAPETLLKSCTHQWTEEGPVPLDAMSSALILDVAAEMAKGALRVLAVACKSTHSLQDAESGMTFLGLAGMLDPPRKEAAEAIQTCMRAGIRVVMITGDHPITGEAIARELDLLGNGRVVTGAELEALPDAELERLVEDINVYARVSPEHKLRVVEAWKKRGHVVGMTGDGVNDAPALKKADVGIAMGITGTEVSREASDMILTDDNFASIVGAVEEGRAIFGNIKKYLMYLISSNIGEIGLMALAAFLGLPLPLTAVQILYVNLATDGLPALALSVDPRARNLMQRPPRNPKSSIFSRPVVTLMLTGGIWSTIINLGLFAGSLEAGEETPHAMAMTFVSLTLIQLFKAYAYRSDRESLFHHPLENRWLDLAVAWELMLLILIVYVPVLQGPFSTHAFSPGDWVLVFATAATVVPVLEITKWMIRRGWLGPEN